jgi:molybdopterin-guanine dinucleotide biosynthesis protein
MMKHKDESVFMGASDVSDYITTQVLVQRNEAGLSSCHKRLAIVIDRDKWILEVDTSGLRHIQFNDERGIVIEDATWSFFKYTIASRTVEIDFHGDYDFVEYWNDHLTATHEAVRNVIQWMYSNDGQTIDIPLRNDKVPVAEMYPWLNGESLESYYERFMESDASILLLIGPPGTGKTTFIRGLLQHTDESAMVTYDASILAKDYVFASFIESKTSVMVIEDADNFLGARSDGNDIMHKFLNVGDGLVTTKNKKLIFSTNLPSIRDIDSALIRAGRCFDIINFTTLTPEQASVLAAKVGVEIEPGKSEYTIADMFHKQTHAPKRKRKVGFV